MNENYWTRRYSRRRALTGAGTVGIGAAAFGLVGCGDDDDDEPTSTATATQPSGGTTQTPGTTATATPETPSFLWDRTDTTAQAKPGGVYQTATTADVTNLDPLSSTSFTAAAWGNWYYPKLMTYKPGYRVAANGAVQTYLAESVEQADDTTINFKLRPNAVWEQGAPLGGRKIDADDVAFSWNKFAASGISRKDLAKLPDNPGGAVESVKAVDASTVQFKLAYPYAPLLAALGYSRYLQVMPVESESGGYDPRNETRSGGPWMLTNYQRSVKFELRKNPTFWGDTKPFLEGFDLPIVPEYAQILAQFKAKKFWYYALRQEDIVQTRKDHSDLQVDANAHGRTCWMMYFGLQPDSPFRDVRVRQAASMLIDREGWVDTFYNVQQFKKENYPIEVRYHSHISAGWDGLWIDPLSDDMGAGKKNFEYNAGEAKKLLEQTGLKLPIETEIAWISTGQYGTTFPQQAELLKGMLEATGLFKLQQVNPDYQTEYLTKYYFGKGDFKGIAIGATTQYPEVDQFLFSYYHSNGSRQKVAFQGTEKDAESDRLLEQQRQELDPTKRAEIIKDWQRHAAETMPMIPYPGQANTFALFWPWIGNHGVFRSWDAESTRDSIEPHLWFDQSKYTG